MDRGDAERGGVDQPETVVQVYQQSFEELNVSEMITRLNHQPRKRSAKKAAK